jgi:hypothetical protein
VSYPTSLLLYEDDPAGSIFKFFFVVVTMALLAVSAYFWVSGDNSSGLAALIVELIIGLIFWVVTPRRHQVYGDHLL